MCSRRARGSAPSAPGAPVRRPPPGRRWRRPRTAGTPPAPRSEEHTSELQSQSNLVCRLLLEKKNNYTLFHKLFNTKYQRTPNKSKASPSRTRRTREHSKNMLDPDTAFPTDPSCSSSCPTLHP